MAAPLKSVVKRSLYSWVWSGNAKLQIMIVLIITVTVGARVLPMEMQKRIVNQAISLKDLNLLYVLCGIYLASIILATGLKYVITVMQTLISQRVLARMRQDLYKHILTLPISFFRKTQPGMVVSSLMTELVAAGDFAGMAIAIPLINTLTLLAFAVYLFWLNWLLAIISLSIYPGILFLVPRLQNKANKMNKKRVDVTRNISNRITDTISGIHEVHGHGSYEIEAGKFNKLVRQLLRIRIVWTLYREGVKVTNNLFTNMGPFLVFLLGGAMAMRGELELGSLVAFVSAQSLLYDPWKELIAFYQEYQDAKVKYMRTMEYFDREPDYELIPYDRDTYKLSGDVEVENLSFYTEDGIRLIDDISFTLKEGEHLALVGFSGSGKSTLAQCIGQLYKYTGGHIYIGEKEVATMSKKDVIANLGYIPQMPFIFTGTFEENLLYSCRALVGPNGAGDGEHEMPNRDDVIGVLQQTGIFVDVLRFGLNSILDQEDHAELVKKIISIRDEFQEEFGEELADYVEFFNEQNFLYFSSVSENLIFGAANRAEFQDQNLPQNEYFINFLNQADLTRPLLSLGAELCTQTVDILRNLPPDKVFFEQSPIKVDEFDDYKELVDRLKNKHLHELAEEDRQILLSLALRFIPGRHKMVGLPKILEGLILEGRALFRSRIGKDHPNAFSFFDINHYIYSQTILNNILFGKTKTTKADVQDKISQSIIQLLIEEDLLETIVEIGMEFDVGSKGENLSGGQRQKLAIARSFLKVPRLLVMDEATSALDNKSQARVQNQLDSKWKGRSTVIAVVHRLDITKNYDKIAVMKAGKIVEMGTYEDLMSRKGMLYELATGKK